MKQDEIIEMARHISKVLGSRMCDENGDTHGEELYCMTFDDIVDAVKLVAAKEREACAKACEELAELNRTSDTDSMWEWGECAAAIRARGNV